MKTIASILRSLLASRKNRVVANFQPEAAPGENNSKLQTPKSNSDETETDEDLRVSRVDNPDARESDGNPEEQEQADASETGGDSGEGESACDPGGEELKEEAKEIAEISEIPKEETTAENEPAEEKETDWEEALREAYQRGVKDGRNAVIEEKYFPRTDDGIPRFRGSSSRPVLQGDIFSMAREA